MNLAYERWSFRQDGLTPAGASLLAIAITVATRNGFWRRRIIDGGGICNSFSHCQCCHQHLGYPSLETQTAYRYGMSESEVVFWGMIYAVSQTTREVFFPTNITDILPRGDLIWSREEFVMHMHTSLLLIQHVQKINNYMK